MTKTVTKTSIWALNPQLSFYRTSGDIDIWLQGTRETVLDYVRHHVPDCKPVYHHVDFPVVEGLDIEVHFTPSWMNSPMTNRWSQRWFRDGLEVKKGVKNAVTSDLQSEVEGKPGFVNPQLNGIGLQIRRDRDCKSDTTKLSLCL